MKGIILAGGSGTRLYPTTRVVSKQLLPVFDKPMVYYPLSTLMLAGIRDILVISTPADTARFSELLGNGNQWGLRIEYAVQQAPDGPAEAFLIGATFIGSDPVALILGDNIFYGGGLSGLLRRTVGRHDGATIFGIHVPDPERYGVVELDNNGQIASIEEKPTSPRSSYAITGLQLYDNRVADIARSLGTSARGEYELADVQRAYLKSGSLRLELLGRGMTWFDAGTHESLQEASSFIQTVEKRQGLKVACLEEIAFRMGYISDSQLRALSDLMPPSGYGSYVRTLLSGESRSC